VRSVARPSARRVRAAARAAAPERHVPRIYYAGDAAGWLEACRETGAEVVGVDWRIGLQAARERLGADVVLQGNLDPAVLLGPIPRIRERAAALLAEACAGRREARGHVFNLGHGILPETPPEHAQALVDAVRELSSRG
jgi:uroporphyrinogen decarboxylase